MQWGQGVGGLLLIPSVIEEEILQASFLELFSFKAHGPSQRRSLYSLGTLKPCRNSSQLQSQS